MTKTAGKKKRKSLVGWSINTWSIAMIESSRFQNTFYVLHDNIYKTKKDCEELYRLPDGKFENARLLVFLAWLDA